ncbi:MAG: hypothetical protein ACI4RM_05670 [Ruminococcus sp.]
MQITDKVKIGGFSFSVKRIDETFIVNGIECDGCCNKGEQIIKVSKTGSLEHQQMVFLHEILHGIYDNYVPDNSYDEETIVTQMANGLYQVLVDNPEIFK